MTTAFHCHELGVEEAQAQLARFRVIDVRQPEEFRSPEGEDQQVTSELGRIPGSENVPLDRVGATAASWDRDTPLLVVCRSGARSGRAAAELVRLGFRDVTNLTGGMLAWNARGLPVARGGAA
jgi:rhodanese-related sulfurtransferase